MAIVIDPDNLDRSQVIFGTETQKLSLYPVGLEVSALSSTGATTASSLTFTDASAGFIADGVAAGDIICLQNGIDAGHYTVDTVNSATSITVLAEGDFTEFLATDTGLVYTINEPDGGSILDGVTKQALYSYGKEEWRSDSATFGGDDLIRHEFPYEAITSEQFEIGGGEAHTDWTYFNEYTRKKIRTGGWADKITAGTTTEEYTGIVTLGALDADTQVYYQQVNEQEPPTDFTFLGPVNESIKIFEDGGADNRTYLKLFARKKGRTYAGSEIADIGVSTIQTIVNRFPLAHTVDAAITFTDAEILGTTPFRAQGDPLESGSDGAVTNEGFTFTSASAEFVSTGVGAGDRLSITSGNQIGLYTIESVDSETVVTIAPDFEFSGWTESEASLTYTTSSTFIYRGRTDGALADVDGDTGTLTSATGGFTGNVSVDDLVIITEAASPHMGAYKVVSVDSDTVLTLNTVDGAFTVQSSIDFDVLNPGMYLQFKQEAITIGATGNLTFTDANPDTIERASGSWVTDGVSIGSVITVSGTETSNDKSFTVAGVTADTLTLVPSDTVVAYTGAATVTAFDAFKRDIGGIIYSYRWRLLGNGGTLQQTYQFVQHQLRQVDDIDWGLGTSRGDVTDLLMQFSTPTGSMLDMFIDNLATTDINNATFLDSTGVGRNFPFLASVTINFNNNLQNDPNAKYWLFFSNDDAGDNTGRDFGTEGAILVKDADDNDITGNIGGQPSVSFTYDYDGNVLRGAASAGTNAPVTLICIGLETAQYVIVTSTITRSTANSISAVAALERNYSNP